MARRNGQVLAVTPSGAFDTVPSIVILHRFALLYVLDAVVANLMLVQCGLRAPI